MMRRARTETQNKKTNRETTHSLPAHTHIHIWYVTHIQLESVASIAYNIANYARLRCLVKVTFFVVSCIQFHLDYCGYSGCLKFGAAIFMHENSQLGFISLSLLRGYFGCLLSIIIIVCVCVCSFRVIGEKGA